MKVLVKPNVSLEEYTSISFIDGFILPLDGYAVDYDKYFTLNDIIVFKEKTSSELFVVLNRMFFNSDIDELKKVLLELDRLGLTGIFFYDLSILKLKKELGLKTALVWNNTHMVTNTEVCNYYFNRGVDYAVLSNEITFKEVMDIYDKSSITLMFPLLLYPTVAHSARHLVTNYDKVTNSFSDRHLKIEEPVTKDTYFVIENDFGTTFKYSKVLNNLSVLDRLQDMDFPYVILCEDFIEHEDFITILNCISSGNDLVGISHLIGENTGFLEKETIYKVKKNG